MSLSKLTILSYEQYLNNKDMSLFDKLILPEGIDKETLTDNILLQCADFEVLYSNPFSMRGYVGIWSKKYYPTFEKWAKALAIDYNPLENYDRMEDWTDTSVGNIDNTDHQEQSIISTSTDDNVTDLLVNTYDSDTLHEKEQTHSNGYTNGTITDEIDANSNISSTDNDHHIGRIHGNIGVTTSQQMLQSELDLARWNIYEQITDLFMNEFVILVYE